MRNPQFLLDNDSIEYLWYFNIDEEDKNKNISIFPKMYDYVQEKLIIQQEQQQIFIANNKDKILMRHKPELSYLDYLKEKGFEIPDLIYSYDLQSNKQDYHIVPYIITDCNLTEEYVKLVGELNNKYEIRKLCEQSGLNTTKGFFCNSINELVESYYILKGMGFDRTVIKVPYGSSGKGLFVLNTEKDFRNILSFLKRRGDNFILLIEGWHDVKRNINTLLYIGENKITFLSITEQCVNSNGVYYGTNYTPTYNLSLIKKYYKQINKLLVKIRDLGYKGFLGIDSFIDTDNNLYPVIEINARCTQVTYLLPLVVQLHKKYRFIESRIKKFICMNKIQFNVFLEELQKKFPKELNNNFLIYTFSNAEYSDKFHYKIGILFFSNDKNNIQNMMDILQILEFE
ncbi:ATP-grasp domain-containing protein [Bacillus cereus]|nr:ATP-grasp domain-containing protein [Bacillus cereus]